MRLSVQAAIFLLLMNSTAIMIGATGYDDVLGVSPQIDDGERFNESEEFADPDNIGGSSGIDALDLASFVMSGASAFFDALTAITVGGPLMLRNAGVHGGIVAFAFSPFYLIIFKDLYGLIKRGD